MWWPFNKLSGIFSGESSGDKEPPRFIRDEKTGINVETDDPNVADFIGQVLNSKSGVMIGAVDENGKLITRELD